jgi:hypothetical protein
LHSPDVFRKEAILARDGIAVGGAFREFFALPQGYKSSDSTKSQLYFPLKIEIDGFEAFFFGTSVAASQPAFQERNYKYRRLLAANFVAVPVITQPMGPESQVINVYMRTLRLRENYMGHYKNANPDIEIDARIPPLHIHVEKQSTDFLLQVAYYLSPLVIPPEVFHHYLFPTVDEKYDHDLSRFSIDLSSIKVTYAIQNGDFLEVSVRKTNAFVHSKRGHKELMLIGGTSAGQTAVGLSITHIVRIESVHCNFVSSSTPRTSHEVVNWNVTPEVGIANSGTHVQPERFAVDYCLRMFTLQNGTLIDLEYVEPTKPSLELQPIFITLSASLVKFIFLAASEIQSIFILDAFNALRQNSSDFAQELLRQICSQRALEHIDVLSFRYKSDWLEHVYRVRVEHDAHCTMTSLSSPLQELQVLGADDLAHRCLKDQQFAAIFGDLCSRTADCSAIRNLCSLFQSSDFRLHKSAQIAIFHFCSQNHKNAELVELAFHSFPSGLEKYMELKNQFVANYAVTANAKMQCHRIRVALIDDELNASPSQQRSSAPQFCSCDIKGLSVRIKRVMDDRPLPLLSRASSPSTSRVISGSPILSPAHSHGQPILHQAVCEIDSVDFDALVRNAASVSAQIKSSREEAHGIRFQADQLQLCTRGPINIGKSASSVQTLNVSISLQDFAAAFDPFARILQSFAYAGSAASRSVPADEPLLDDSGDESELLMEGAFLRSQAQAIQTAGQCFRMFENSDVKFDGLILDLEVKSVLDEVTPKIILQMYPLQFDSRSFSCHGVRISMGREQRDVTLLHILPLNSDQVGSFGSASSLQALQHAIHVDYGCSFLSLEFADIFVGSGVFDVLEDMNTMWFVLSQIPAVIASSTTSEDANDDMHDCCAPNDPSACLRVRFTPFFIYNEAMAHPLLFTSTSALQKRVAARVFGNSAMVSPITGGGSPATNVQDASAQTLDPLSLRYFGESTPSARADDRVLFRYPAADGSRLSYSAEEVSRISASAGNLSAIPLYSVIEQDREARGPLAVSIRLSLGVFTVTVPGRDNVSTSCSFGARFECACSATAPSQLKIDAALECLRIYRTRSRSVEHDIIRGAAFRVQVMPGSESAGVVTNVHHDIVITLQRGVKVCLGTNSISSVNHVASDIDEILKLFVLTSPSSSSSMGSVNPDTRPVSPEPRSSAISDLLELDAPPPIFGSPLRVVSKSSNQRSLNVDETARNLSFGNEEEYSDPYHSVLHSGFASGLTSFFKSSQVELVLAGGGNGESVFEVELICGSAVSGNTAMRPLYHSAVGVVRMHLVAHCPGGEPFLRLSPSQLPWHAVNVSMIIPSHALTLYGSVSNFALRIDCASSPGISCLCPVTLFQLAVYCLPRTAASVLADASCTSAPARLSAALHIGAVSVDSSSSMALWCSATSAIQSVLRGCNESKHARRTLNIINRTGSPLYFFDPDRQRIDAGCFRIFVEIEASSAVPFYVADVPHSCFSPPLMLFQAERYYSVVHCENGLAYAAVVDVVIDAAEARVTCTISSCVSVSNLLQQPLCVLAIPDDSSAARFVCEIPSCVDSESPHSQFLPLHELHLPLVGSVPQLERIVFVPASIWREYVRSQGLSSSVLDGYEFTSAFDVSKDRKCDFMEMYTSILQQELNSESTRIEKPNSACVRWSVGSNEVHARVSVDARQRVQPHHSLQIYGPSKSDAHPAHLMCIDVVVRPEVVIISSLPYTVHVCLHPVESLDDASHAEESVPIFAGVISSGSSVSVNSHLWQSMRISLRAVSSESGVMPAGQSPSEICHILFSDRHVARCPVLVSGQSSVFPKFCDVRVESTVVDGSQLRITLVSPGIVRNGTNLPLFVQFFASADAVTASSGECYLPPRPVAFDTRSAVLKWWNCHGGLRDLLADSRDNSSVGRDCDAANTCARMHSPFQDSCAVSTCNGFGDVATQIDSFISIRLDGCASAKGDRVRDLRSGEVFSFDVCGVIHDVVVELKTVRGFGGETVQHVSLLPSVVITNRR